MSDQVTNPAESDAPAPAPIVAPEPEKSGYSDINALGSIIYPAVLAAMNDGKIKFAALTVVAGDGSTSTINFPLPRPKGMTSLEETEFEIKKTAILAEAAGRFAKTYTFLMTSLTTKLKSMGEVESE